MITNNKDENPAPTLSLEAAGCCAWPRFVHERVFTQHHVHGQLADEKLAQVHVGSQRAIMEERERRACALAGNNNAHQGSSARRQLLIAG